MKSITKKTLSEFLSLYSKPKTRRVYASALYTFSEFILKIKRKNRKITPDEVIMFDKAISKYMQEPAGEEHSYFDDLLKFAAYMNSSGRPPKTAKAYISAIKEFFGYNEIELTQRQIKTIRLKLPKGNARTVKNDIDSTVIRKISEHTDVKGRALFFMLKGTGMRLGEALSITLDELDLNSSPACITIRGEHAKNGQQRIAFIDREAKEILNEWLKIREKYLVEAVNKNNGLVKNGVSKPKSADDNRLFPFSDSVAEQMWTTAITNAGLLSIDKVTNRKQLRIHDLRMFYRSQLALGCPVDIVEELMGHDGYLTDAYRRYTKAQMAEHYLKHQHLLYIQMPKDIQRIESEFKDELNNNRKLVESLVVKNLDLMKQMDDVKKTSDGQDEKIKELKKAISDFEWLLNVMRQNPEFLEMLARDSRNANSETKN